MLIIPQQIGNQSNHTTALAFRKALASAAETGDERVWAVQHQLRKMNSFRLSCVDLLVSISSKESYSPTSVKALLVKYVWSCRSMLVLLKSNQHKQPGPLAWPWALPKCKHSVLTSRNLCNSASWRPMAVIKDEMYDTAGLAKQSSAWIFKPQRRGGAVSSGAYSYDPPTVADLSYHLTGEVTGAPAQFLFDSGSAVNAISESFCRRSGIASQDCDVSLVTV